MGFEPTWRLFSDRFQRKKTGVRQAPLPERTVSPLKQDLLNSVSRRILFEELERRQLLSADLNPIAGSIDVPGETDRYIFSLTSETKLYVDSETPNPGLTWSLTGPGGSEVSDRFLANSDSAGLGAASPIVDLVSGDYTLSVSGAGDATGTYKFQLLDLANAAPVGVGAAIAGQLEPGASTNLYAFTAAAGDHVYFDQLTGGGPASLTWRVFGPSGNQVSFSAFNDFELQSMPVGGTYTLAVEGAVQNTAAANYSFALVSVVDTQNSVSVGAPLT